MKNNNLLIALTIGGMIAITTFASQQSSWSSWATSPSAWYESAKQKASAAASSASQMAQAAKKRIGLENASFTSITKTIAIAIAALIAIGYTKENIKALVGNILSEVDAKEILGGTLLGTAAGVAALEINAQNKLRRQQKIKSHWPEDLIR